ncbi:MAG: DUF3276 family protein [Saprospiraceae bacterium]|nr:MAG: DUF3276 family protein [Saprospiraceae bacterium]
MNDDRRFESVFSQKVRAGKRRTYFFDVRKTKGEDFYVTLTESTKKFEDNGFERHKIFLYKEDFNRFLAGLEDAINYVKKELMPDYDYEEFDRRQEEWETHRAEEDAAEAGSVSPKPAATDAPAEIPESDTTSKDNSDETAPDATKATVKEENKETTEDDDMSW